MKITLLIASICYKRVSHKRDLPCFHFFWQIYVTETVVVMAYVSRYPLQPIPVSVMTDGAETTVKNVGFV